MPEIEFTDLPLEEQDRIRHVLRETNSLAFSYAAVLVIAPPPSRDGHINHASGVIVCRERNFFFLTAEHVVSAWQQRHAQDPAVMMHLAAPTGSATFTGTDRLLYEDADCDIAVLSLTPEEAASTGTLVYDIHEWPPPVPTVGEMVYITGFPHVGRVPLRPKAFEFRAFNLGTNVTTVATGNFKCHFERQFWISESHMSIDDAPASLDGISGGPVMAMGGLQLRFVGTVIEHQESLDILVVGTWSGVPDDVFSVG